MVSKILSFILSSSLLLTQFNSVSFFMPKTDSSITIDPIAEYKISENKKENRNIMFAIPIEALSELPEGYSVSQNEEDLKEEKETEPAINDAADSKYTEEVPEEYREYIDILKQSHPEWTFNFYNTNLDWNSVVKAETAQGKNAITASRPEKYRSTTYGYVNVPEEHRGYVLFENVKKDASGQTVIYSPASNATVFASPNLSSQAIGSLSHMTAIGVFNIVHDTENDSQYWCEINYTTYTSQYTLVEGVSWYQPADDVVKHYLDPRNFLNEKDIFQFEELSYSSSNKTTIENIEKALSDSFMNNCEIETTDGSITTYSQALLKAAEEYKVNPYHLIARIYQEVGSNAGSSAAKGTNSTYPGIFNFYNIGANTGVLDGLKWASGTDEEYLRPWNTPYKSLMGGAKYIADGYISQSQNTLYFQKFAVSDPESLYSHQYMSNIEAAYTESHFVRQFYENNNLMTSNFNFIIPIYNNLPESVCLLP